MTREIKPELLDELLSGLERPEDLLGDAGLFRQLKKALMERALGGELTHHLGYEKGDPGGRGSGNSRNGHSSKTVLTEEGELDLSIPRDRAGTFEPQLVPKGVTRLDGFDDKVISLYARGLTVREIQGHLKELYGTEVSPDLISRVTDAVLDEVKEWQARPLDACYPIVFFDALRVKIRDEGLVRNKAVYVALALDVEGHKHVLGLWIEQTEGAKFWLKVMNDLKTRGLADILIAVVDGLRGFSGSNRRCVPRDDCPDVHRPPDPQQPGVRVMEGPQADHARSEGDLPRRERRGRARPAGSVRGQLGRSLSGDRRQLATGLGACDPAVRVPARHPQDDLHHQRGGKPQSLAA